MFVCRWVLPHFRPLAFSETMAILASWCPMLPWTGQLQSVCWTLVLPLAKLLSSLVLLVALPAPLVLPGKTLSSSLGSSLGLDLPSLSLPGPPQSGPCGSLSTPISDRLATN